MARKECFSQGQLIRIHKIRSHYKDVASVPIQHQQRKHCSDHHAGEAVVVTDDGDARKMTMIDRNVLCIQVAIVHPILLLPSLRKAST